MKAMRATWLALGAVAIAASAMPIDAQAEDPAPGSVIDRSNVDN